jgi:glutamate racemase
LDLPHLAPDKRVLGVIRPSSEILGSYSSSHHLGILGTTGTIQSESYPIELAKFAPDASIFQQACPMWVPLIENGQQDGLGADYFVQLYIDQLFAQSAQIDTVLLACTHYPLMEKKIQSFLPEHVKLVTQGDIVAKSLATYLQNHPEMDQKCSKNGQLQFFTTDNPTSFEEQGSLFFGQKIAANHTDLA